MTERLARKIVLSVLAHIEVGRLTVVEGGERLSFGRGAPEATVCIQDPAAWRALLRGSRGMAEAYRDGLWDSPDLTAVIRVGARNVAGIDAIRRRLSLLREPFQRGACRVPAHHARAARARTSRPTTTSATSCSG